MFCKIVYFNLRKVVSLELTVITDFNRPIAKIQKGHLVACLMTGQRWRRPKPGKLEHFMTF